MTLGTGGSLTRPLSAARLCWGTLLLRFPDTGLRLLGHPPTRSARRVVRILGLRQVLQGAAMLVVPGPTSTAVGIAVDALHASSAVGWAAGRPGQRRPGATSATVSGLTAAAGLAALRQQSQAAADRRRPRRPARRTHIPGDDVAHDSRHGTQHQLVFLEGGPLAGARVGVPWTRNTYEALDEQQRPLRYVDSGRTTAAALGSPARVFVHDAS